MRLKAPDAALTTGIDRPAALAKRRGWAVILPGAWQAVWGRGKVYATDIQPEMLDLLRKNIAARRLTNVEPVLGAEDDPKLPPGQIELILLVDVYHEFSQPQKMLRKMRESLKPDGRLVLLEYRKEDPNIPIRPEHKMSVEEVRAEVQPEGFRFEKNLDTLPRQHILIFRKSVQ